MWFCGFSSERFSCSNGTRWKVLWESKSPRKRFCRQHLATLVATCTILRPASPNFPTELFCKQSPVFVNNCRFTEFFDRYFHIPLPIVTKHLLGLHFPPRNLRIKFGANPSTIFLVIVVTGRHTHTHKPTPVKTYALAYVGIIMHLEAFIN